MSKYSNLISFVDYTDFSLLKSFFWGNNDKKEIENNTKRKKEGLKKTSTFTKVKYSLNENQKKLILKLEAVIDAYLYRKKVKKLIKTIKDNYIIICTSNIPNLSLNLIRTKEIKKYKLKYEPILKENVAFLPRKKYRNKKKLKFNFINNKKEIYIEPQYQTEYEDGSFVNVLDLQDLKEKEYKNEEEFRKFLKIYKNSKKEEKKIEVNKTKKDEENKNELKIIVNRKEINKTKENNEKSNINKINNIRLVDNQLFKSDKTFNNTVKKKKHKSRSLLNNKNTKMAGLNSILKERSSQRIKKGRQISFGGTQFSS